MILNIARTILQLRKYAGKKAYPTIELLVYVVVSITVGVLLSRYTTIENLRILTVASILFGFSINALVLLSSNVTKYVQGETQRHEKIESYYKQTLYVTIHSLGVGFVLILVTSFALLLPDIAVQFRNVDLIQFLVFTFAFYYIITISTVMASLAELVHIQAHEPLS